VTLCLAGNTIRVRRIVALLLVDLPDGDRRRYGNRVTNRQELLRRFFNIPDGFFASFGACGSDEPCDLPWGDLEDLRDSDLGPPQICEVTRHEGWT
jgi:hypothetical protein